MKGPAFGPFNQERTAPTASCELAGIACWLTINQAYILAHHSSNFAFDPSYSPRSLKISTFFEYNEVVTIAMLGPAPCACVCSCRFAICVFCCIIICWHLAMSVLASRIMSICSLNIYTAVFSRSFHPCISSWKMSIRVAFVTPNILIYKEKKSTSRGRIGVFISKNVDVSRGHSNDASLDCMLLCIFVYAHMLCRPSFV